MLRSTILLHFPWTFDRLAGPRCATQRSAHRRISNSIGRRLQCAVSRAIRQKINKNHLTVERQRRTHLQITKRRFPNILLQFDAILIGETANIRYEACDQQHVAGQFFNLKLEPVECKTNSNHLVCTQSAIGPCSRRTFLLIDAIVLPPSPVR